MIAIGREAMTGLLASAANGSVAIGAGSLRALRTGFNTAVGFDAGRFIQAGTGNALFGATAGDTLITGNNNTIIGHNADVTATARSGCVVIGTGASGAADNTLVIRVGNSSTTEIVTSLSRTAKGTSTSTVDANTDYLTVTIGGVTRYIELKTTP
jgi:hypothetical protein